MLCFAAVCARASVIEYFEPDLNNCFITADPNEQAFVDSGAVGRWQRTGNTFTAGGPNQVCRFYGNTNVNPATGTVYGPNSHFFTADPAECAGLKAIDAPSAKSWKFESNDFLTTLAVNGTCASGLVPVYRAYHNGLARGLDSNHRITSNLSACQQTVAAGSIGEGIVMCAPPNAVVSLYFSEAGTPDTEWDNELAGYKPRYWDAVTYHEYVHAQDSASFDELIKAANGNLLSRTTRHVTDYLMPMNKPGVTYVVSEVSPSAGEAVVNGALVNSLGV